MKILTSVCYYIFLCLILFGLIFRTIDWRTGNIYFFLGLFGLFIFFIAKTIKGFLNKRMDKANGLIQILFILMSITFYAKYLYFRFWDYPGIIITPIFVFSTIFYLVKAKSKELKLIITSILYLVLAIPLFGVQYDGAPRFLIPLEWHNRYDVETSAPIDMPYSFEYRETEQLSVKAHALKKAKRYYEAINIYQQAMKIESKNPKLYFDLSECYARINNLENAISLLDTAILLDSTFFGSFNNRGLLFYKLNEDNKAIKDYLKAIQLNSTQSTIFANLALVYYYEKEFDKACRAMQKAKQLGLDVTYQEMLRRDIKMNCD